MRKAPSQHRNSSSSSWVCHGNSPSQRTMRTTASLTSARSTRCHASFRPSTTPGIETREPAAIGLGLAVKREICPETVNSALAPVAGLLVAPERAGRVKAVEGVGPHYAGLHGGHHLEDAAPLLGPYACRQAVRRVVGFLDGFLRSPEGQDREDRTKDLLLGDPMALADAGEERRAEEVATRGELTVGLEDLGALLDAGVDQLLDLG